MQRSSRLGAGTQNAYRDLEAVIGRNSLVEQEFRGARVLLRSFVAPAPSLPAYEGRSQLFHGDNLSQQRHARPTVRCF